MCIAECSVKRGRKGICRVCLNKSNRMVDIFVKKSKPGVPITDLILQCTGNTVNKDASYPNYICISCLGDAEDAFEIIEIFKRNHRIFCQLKEQQDREEDIPEKEAGKQKDFADDILTIDLISEKSNGSNSEADDCPVWNEAIEEYTEKEFEKLSEGNNDTESNDYDIFVKEDEEPQEKEDTISEGITISDEDEDESEFRCFYCPKIFKTKIGLIRHNILHSDELPFKCAHCPKSFRRKANHKEHLLTHTKERQLQCNLCPRTFLRIRYLEEHLLSHSGERPHKCEACKKCFRRVRDLKRHHVETHIKERPFQCPDCMKTFSRNAILTLHMQLHCKKRVTKKKK
ncbi:zinc finger and SCAN domain-containing protein 12 [Drosophila ananassae]|uniref:zinc finger and SCAN domain-containing protein 12 n=1 Tax=Drosophila ananassae TaxID=7217 RepID=UPI0013A5E9F9|nr:zinc finger and SCAN domain-containing protein 12 [Drosophila ananassae]